MTDIAIVLISPPLSVVPILPITLTPTVPVMAQPPTIHSPSDVNAGSMFLWKLMIPV